MFTGIIEEVGTVKAVQHSGSNSFIRIEAKKVLLDIAEADLRKSRNIYDLIYLKKWVDRKRPKDIQRELDLLGMSYSRGHIYVIINRIKAQINRDF